MSWPLILRPAAEEDVEAAYRWYEEHKHARRALLRRFPYALFYVASPELIEVIGCIHTCRHPRRWRSRL